MANYRFSSDLIADALFRAGEPTNGTSQFHDRAVVYLNRAYQAVWLGGSEIESDINETWWWLQREGTLVLPPAVRGGATVTEGASIVGFTSFSEDGGGDLTESAVSGEGVAGLAVSGCSSNCESAATTPSLVGWHIRFAGRPTVYEIIAHEDGAPSATLDQAYLEGSASLAFLAFKLDFDLAADLLDGRVLSPMRAHRKHAHGDNIDGVPYGTLWRNTPLPNTPAGVPSEYAQLTERDVRFNAFTGSTDTPLRVSYLYFFQPADLTDSPTEEPVVPFPYRRVLSDIVTYWLHLDKNDDRADAAILAAKALLRAMQREHRKRLVVAGRLGHIYPRSRGRSTGGVLRTESGSIIG